MKFTVASVKSIVLPEGVSEKTYFCDSLPGFGVRVRSGGGKTYVVQYKTHTGKNRRVAWDPRRPSTSARPARPPETF